MSLPKTAYILLWFPAPTETFIFREVINLRGYGLPLKVFTLYGEFGRKLYPEPASVQDVERLGIPFLKAILPEVAYWSKKDPAETAALFKSVPFRRWSGIEKGGENLWAFCCGFRLARRFEEEGIEHIHAPWASGPATAAWVASRLTGIPYSFTARAWDIYPPDGALAEKIRDASLVRCETMANIRHLSNLAPKHTGKLHLTYNGVPLTAQSEAPVLMRPPYKLLALGRFVGKKGYDRLIRACRILKDSGLQFHLTLAGAGPREKQLKFLAWRLGLSAEISFPGFVPHDEVPHLICRSDIFIMPSVIHSSGDRDGIPTVIMEALAHRVPVVATDVSGIGELIDNENTGLLIPEKDPEAIASAVTRLTGNREFSLRLAENGRRRVFERFNPEVNHRAVLELYRGLC